MAGFGRIFSLPNATRLGFGFLKIGLVTTVLILGVWNRWGTISSLGNMPVGMVASFVGILTYRGQAAAVLLSLVFGRLWLSAMEVRTRFEDDR